MGDTEQSPKPADDVAAMVKWLCKIPTGIRLGYAVKARIERAAAMLTRLEAERDGYRDRAEAAEKRNAELETSQRNYETAVDGKREFREMYRKERDRCRRAEVLLAEAMKVLEPFARVVNRYEQMMGMPDPEVKAARAFLATRQAEQIEALRAESDVSDALLADAKARAEAAEKRNAELEAFVKLCADGFFIADDELQGAAMATLKEKHNADA